MITTLDCPRITNKRADGNSTRQADFAIQKLFSFEPVLIEDHFRNPSADEFLFKKITDRLKHELAIDRRNYRGYVLHVDFKNKILSLSVEEVVPHIYKKSKV